MLQNKTTPHNLSIKKMRALPHLAAGSSVSEAAVAVGVDRTTLYRWMEDDEFRTQLERLRSEAADLARTELKGLMYKAVQVLDEAMDDPDPRLRLRAAQTALSTGLKAIDLKEIEQRLQLLDDALPLWARRNRSW